MPFLLHQNGSLAGNHVDMHVGLLFSSTSATDHEMRAALSWPRTANAALQFQILKSRSSAGRVVGVRGRHQKGCGEPLLKPGKSLMIQVDSRRTHCISSNIRCMRFSLGPRVRVGGVEPPKEQNDILSPLRKRGRAEQVRAFGPACCNLMLNEHSARPFAAA